MAAKIAVLLSGSGTTLQNLIDRAADGALDVEIACVLSSRADVYGLERAQQAGIPTHVVARKSYGDAESFSEAVWSTLAPYEVDLVVLAGFMSLLRIPPAYTNRVMNVHPSLIPAFSGKGMYGHHVHEAVIAKGVKLTGVTIHFVDNEYDQGPIILQAVVPIEDEDTPDSLGVRVQAKEREVYPVAIQLFVEGKLRVDGRRVRVLN